MPFNRLLFCALEEDCSHTEGGVSAALSSMPDTNVLLFKLDKHADGSRDALGLGQDDKLCDLLLYVVGRRNGELRRVLCFVECKGTEHDQALAQLESTATVLVQRLPGGVPRHVRVIGAVRSNVGSAPKHKQKRHGHGPLECVEVCRHSSQLEALVDRYLGKAAG